ncbi:MAG: gamma-glutamyltransferase, partial [Nocardioides sp.]|uniref:gamma-glutamyltransferase family protein n=1 Tax=Nocardioides sp. TaxID=35761 RepID=UPI0039E4E044
AGRPTAARGRGGGVAAPHHLASRAGIEVLSAGGSAVDAAIAANAVLTVVDPSAAGLGGDAFWLVWSPRDGRVVGLNGSGRSGSLTPLAGREGTLMERVGPATVTVPGAVRSWLDAHRRFGRLPTERLLAPAISAAQDGFPASPTFVDDIEWMHRAATGSAHGSVLDGLLRRHGRPWRPSEIVRLPRLAATLDRLATAGLADFYEGQIAADLERYFRSISAPIAAGDLTRHTSLWCEPVSATYRGVELVTTPPNSSGVTALEILSILGETEPPAPDEVDTVGWWHRGIEAAKLALADRDAVLTDPDDLDPTRVASLLSREVARDRARRIAPYADLDGLPVRALVGGTAVIVTADADGSIAVLIQSVASRFGALLADPVTGVHLHNRGSAFSTDPAHPNALRPGARVASSLIPLMVLRNGRPWVALATMGGDSQAQLDAQVVSRLVDGRQSPESALAAPRWYAVAEEEAGPTRRVRCEPHTPASLLDGLAGLGHQIESTSAQRPWTGRMQCLAVEADGTLLACTDPRSLDGAPAVALPS